MIVAVAGSTLVGAYSASQSRDAARDAAGAQTDANTAALAQNQAQFEASQALQARLAGQANATQMNIANMSIAAQREQFREVQRVLSPFVTAGNQAIQDLKPYEQAGQLAIQGQQDLIGLGGAGAQQQAIDNIANGVEMQSLTQQGENAILQNASATGGLRGGNTQQALATFRPATLSALINQQYERLGGLSTLGANTTGSIAQLGQASAAQQASASTALGNGISGALGQAGSNMAGLAASNMTNMANINSQYGNNQQALTQQQGQISAGLSMANANANIGFANSLASGVSSVAMMNALRTPSSTGITSGVSSNGSLGSTNYGLGSSSGSGLGFKF